MVKLERRYIAVHILSWYVCGGIPFLVLPRLDVVKHSVLVTVTILMECFLCALFHLAHLGAATNVSNFTSETDSALPDKG